MLLAVNDLKVKIFADGADLQGMIAIAKNPIIKGLTTNPTLMRKSGVTNYEGFARVLLSEVPDKPVSLEVFADDIPTMIKQGLKIGSWGKNANVKVPVTTTNGLFTGPVIRELANAGIVVNVTAVFTVEQVVEICDALLAAVPAIISVFAGRIADTGRDPIPQMAGCLYAIESAQLPNVELLWASPRELLNIMQANEIGCHIITCGADLIDKLHLVGKDLNEYSRQTVQMFCADAIRSGFSIDVKEAA